MRGRDEEAASGGDLHILDLQPPVTHGNVPWSAAGQTGRYRNLLAFSRGWWSRTVMLAQWGMKINDISFLVCMKMKKCVYTYRKDDGAIFLPPLCWG